MTRSDDWETVYEGVVRRVGAPRTWEQAEMAGCLSADGIASHRAAGVLWRLPDIEPRLEITIPQRRKAVLDGFVVHRTRLLQPVDRARRSGIPVTSLARTVIDVALEVPRIAPGLVNHVLARRKVPLALPAMLAYPSARWFGADGAQARDDVLREALDAALDELRERLGDDMAAWRWGALHKATFAGQLGMVPGLEELLTAGVVELG
ncbi:MAG TPA: penicillin acylase family protein, partial [Actinomycetota bacterium]|nr:penicillin acylase family protein [Actinomycetota bacterium]